MDDLRGQQMKIPVVIKEEPIDATDEENLSMLEPEKQQMKIPVIKEEPIDATDEENLSMLEPEKQQMQIPVVIKEEPKEEIDEESLCVIELVKIKERVNNLEWIVVPEHDNIIEEATQVLNTWDGHRQERNIGPVFSSEHVEQLRLLLIAVLIRADALSEIRRLRNECTFLPVENMWKRFTDLTAHGDGKTLVIQSLRVPILSYLNRGRKHKKMKYNSSNGFENLTRWPSEYRYFVCAIRAGATIYRPPLVVASRPVDVVEESALRFSNDITTCRNKEEKKYGYVEFITKKREMNSGSGMCAGPTESDGAPIMIHGLDDKGWKITVDLYGISPTGAKEYVHGNGSVLDQLLSALNVPGHGSTTTTCIVTSRGPIALNNTVIRQLGYFDFSANQVDIQQFTLNKMYDYDSVPSSSSVTTNVVAEKTVGIRMGFLQ
ncbi:hypothetical protein QTP88_011041 [Uroleucon formosanum]